VEQSLYRELFAQLNLELRVNREFGFVQAAICLLKRALIQTARFIHQRGRSYDIGHERFHNAIRLTLPYIHRHFREDLTLEQAANNANVSANYYSTLFSTSLGVPYQRYVQDLRLRFAKTLLYASDLPITEVCMASGFNNLSHFERVFKARFGQSPGGYRKSQRQ